MVPDKVYTQEDYNAQVKIALSLDDDIKNGRATPSGGHADRYAATLNNHLHQIAQIEAAMSRQGTPLIKATGLPERRVHSSQFTDVFSLRRDE